jgi:hypothetical protein
MANVKKDALSPLVHDDQTDHIVGVKNSDGSEKAFVYTDGSQAMTGNLIFGTSGHGIDFSADGNAAGMTSELLDDYEEGTWTPTIEGVTTPGTYEINTAANLRNATYIKVGRMVTLSARFQLAAVVTGGGSGAVVIGGIPFSVAADRTCLGSIALGTVSFSGSLSVSPRSITAASTQLNIFKSTDATGITLVAVSDIDAGDVFQFTITYAAT